MSTLFKKTSTRWILDGRRVKAGTPGAVKVKEKSDEWYRRYKGPDGKWRAESLGLTDKQCARTEAVKRDRDEERREVGIIDHYTDHAVTPIGQHVDEWLADMTNAGATERRREDVGRRVRKLVAVAGWKRLSAMTPETASAALAKLTRRGQSGKPLALSVQTRNDYIQHVKQFAIWCVPERLPANPLAKLKRTNPEPHMVHRRRELLAAEQAKLILTTEESPVTRFGLDGPSRALLYELALATGLRRNELRSLSPASFALDAGSVTVAAAYSKHRREDVQSLPPVLIERLRAWFAAGKPLWPNLTAYTARMFKADLEAAGVPYVVPGPDGQPLYADFHSTRHSFISGICRTNASPKEAQEIARHSDPRLTFKTYAKIRLHDKASVVAQLPDPRAGLAAHRAAQTAVPA